MDDPNSGASRLPLSRAFRAALAILLLTSVHHAYGAYIYRTPWRLHVAVVAVLTAWVLWIAARVIRSYPAGPARGVATVAFCLVDAIVPVLAIGFFEGGYNHVLKNALYFIGSSPLFMTRLFPPPVYELPNDVIFEASGIVQFVIGVVAAYRLHGFIRHRRHSGRGAQAGLAVSDAPPGAG